MKKINLPVVLFIALFSACTPVQNKITSGSQSPGISNKPYARYWWFASMIREEDVRYNLD